MTTKQSSKQTAITSGSDLEGVIGAPLDEKLADFDARLDEKLAGFKKELKTEIMLESLVSNKETAAANDTSSHKDFISDASGRLPSTTTAVPAQVGCEASHSSSSTTQQQRVREEGIKRIYTIEGCSYSRDYSFRCFVLDLENGEETTLTISPAASDEDQIEVHLGFSVVALGSIIYLIGGRCSPRRCPDGLRGTNHRHRYVRYFDANEPEKGWKLGVPMQTGRAWAAAAAIDEKIYVFGGLVNKSDARNNDVFGWAPCSDVLAWLL
ncbi:Galactose oxidase, beta-propeller [Corchorus olitorius]|uniref:Galactose oxidase, beta-propeller n=1 Tax=Corchorus olitorius TaxID=93759 RepID=A0A1R3H4X8_9ROSI|nr:Galactose oxidase, beta-propeller [Corchorus olitorius]